MSSLTIRPSVSQQKCTRPKCLYNCVGYLAISRLTVLQFIAVPRAPQMRQSIHDLRKFYFWIIDNQRLVGCQISLATKLLYPCARHVILLAGFIKHDKNHLVNWGTIFIRFLVILLHIQSNVTRADRLGTRSKFHYCQCAKPLWASQNKLCNVCTWKLWSSPTSARQQRYTPTRHLYAADDVKRCFWLWTRSGSKQTQSGSDRP